MNDVSLILGVIYYDLLEARKENLHWKLREGEVKWRNNLPSLLLLKIKCCEIK
jgi:hypothetical protein